MDHDRVYGLFNNFEDAATAINQLTNDGFDPAYISVATHDSDGRFAKYVDADVHVEGDEGAGFGAIAGALVGLGVMAIPGIGPIMAAGPLAAALTGATTGAVAGAATGGLVGTLIDWGTSEEEAQRYHDILNTGGAIVVADVYDEVWEEKVEAIFEANHAVDVEDHDA